MAQSPIHCRCPLVEGRSCLVLETYLREMNELRAIRESLEDLWNSCNAQENEILEGLNSHAKKPKLRIIM